MRSVAPPRPSCGLILVLVALLPGSHASAQISVRPAAPSATVQRVGPILAPDGLGKAIATRHLQISTYSTRDVVTPGSVFSVVVDIKPRHGVHVYAPGATDYRVIALEIDSAPFLKARPMRFPPSEMYYFAPLKERVPVYQRPFRLVQELAVDGSRAAVAQLQGVDALGISGTLDYQACDDQVCYAPVSVPLSWSVKLGAGGAPVKR